MGLRSWVPDVGEMVGLNPGWLGGVWLRESPQEWSNPGGWVVEPGGLVVVVDVDCSVGRDPWVKVVACGSGVVGWTKASRLDRVEAGE